MVGIIATFISFTIYVMTHWALLRFVQWRPLSKTILLPWALNLLLYAALFFWLGAWFPAMAADVLTWNGAVNFLNGLVINFCLLIGYWDFFFLVERGFSLRMMIEISQSPQRKLTLEEIEKVYSYDYILNKRIGQLVQMGYWTKEGDTYRSTPKGRRQAQFNKLSWKVLNIKRHLGA